MAPSLKPNLNCQRAEGQLPLSLCQGYLDHLKYVPGGTNVSGNACYIWTAPKKSVPTCVCTAASSELSAKVKLTFFSAAKVTTVKRLKILVGGLALIDNEFWERGYDIGWSYLLRYSWLLFRASDEGKEASNTKRAVNLVVEAGEVFMKKKERKVCMYTLIYIYIYI